MVFKLLYMHKYTYMYINTVLSILCEQYTLYNYKDNANSLLSIFIKNCNCVEEGIEFIQWIYIDIGHPPPRF